MFLHSVDHFKLVSAVRFASSIFSSVLIKYFRPSTIIFNRSCISKGLTAFAKLLSLGICFLRLYHFVIQIKAYQEYLQSPFPNTWDGRFINCCQVYRYRYKVEEFDNHENKSVYILDWKKSEVTMTTCKTLFDAQAHSQKNLQSLPRRKKPTKNGCTINSIDTFERRYYNL